MIELINNLFANGLIYLLLYLWLFLVAVLEAFREFREYKSIFAFCTCVILILFTGLRWETGTDWIGYKELFDSLELDWTFLLNVYSFDLGYVIFNAIVKIFTDNYTIFLILDSVLALGIVFSFLLKFSPNPNLSFFVFYNAFFVSQFMGSNRRIIAMGAALFVFYYVFTQKKLKYTVWHLLAFLFHRSSIMVGLTWLIPKQLFSVKKISSILVFSLIMGILELPFKFIGFLGTVLSTVVNNPLVEKMLFYSENQLTVSENINPLVLMTLSVIKRSIFLSFYLLIIKVNRHRIDGVTGFFFNLYVVGFAMYMFLNGSPIFQMVSTYFTFIEIALIGRMWAFADKHQKTVFLFVLFIYGFFQLLSALAAYPELYLPYKSFLTY
jgi:hypothetical protein